MDLINTMTNVDGVWADTIIFFSVVAVMVLAIILSIDESSLEDKMKCVDDAIGYSMYH